MNWLIFTAISVLSDSSRIYIDNYISDYYYKGKSAAAQKVFYAGAFSILALVLLAIGNTHYPLLEIPFSTIILFIISGMFVSIAGIPYYKVLELDNSTNLSIFVQFSPILYLIFGFIFLGENISIMQLVAFFIILAAPLSIILSAKKRDAKRLEFKAAAYAFLYVLMIVIGNLIFVKQNAVEIPFVTELALTFLGKGIGNTIITILMPKWRKRYREVSRRSHGQVYRPLLCTFIACVLKDIMQYSAMIAAPSVALVSVVADSSKPVVIFIMGIIMTILWPKFGREDLSRRSIALHLLTTILIVIGVFLLQ